LLDNARRAGEWNGMKKFLKSRAWKSIIIFVCVVLVALALATRKSVLIAYHRNAMVGIWQTALGISPRRTLVDSISDYLGLALSLRNPEAAVKAFPHREALFRLGYFTKRTFSLSPVMVGTQAYQQLCNRVAAQTGQRPTAQLEYDQATSPSKVLGLTVYATPEDMAQWEDFVTDIERRR